MCNSDQTITITLTDEELNLIEEALSSLSESREYERKWAECGHEQELAEDDKNCIDSIEALQEKLGNARLAAK